MEMLGIVIGIAALIVIDGWPTDRTRKAEMERKVRFLTNMRDEALRRDRIQTEEWIRNRRDIEERRKKSKKSNPTGFLHP